MAVAVTVAVAVQVALAVAVGVEVAVGLEAGPVVNCESKSSFSALPLSALTVPTNLTLYFVLIASAPIGTSVAVSPSQKTLVARMRTSPTASSRKVSGFSVSHFIGRSKITVTEVRTDTSRVPLAGSMETTLGRTGSLAAAAADPPAHRIITIAATKTLLTMCLSTIVPVVKLATLKGQGLCRSVISPICRSSRRKMNSSSQMAETMKGQTLPTVFSSPKHPQSSFYRRSETALAIGSCVARIAQPAPRRPLLCAGRCINPGHSRGGF